MQIAAQDRPVHSWATVERDLAREWRRATRRPSMRQHRRFGWLWRAPSEYELLADWTTMLRGAPWVG